MSNIYFMCENCGIETNGITFVNGMKFCAKCYHQIFGKDNQQTEITQLKQQLAEKDCRIEELEGQFAYECECNKQLVDLQKQLEEKQKTIDEINKEFVQAVHDWKTLCAEKDKEIETMKKDSDKNIDYLVEFASLIENEKDCNRMLKALDRVKSGNKYIIDKTNQSKTEFAIEKLQRVKEICDKKFDWWEKSEFEGDIYDKLDVSNAYLDVSANVEEIIKELKGEKDEKDC